jgi:4'-phosphopantetheinyl transferase
MSADSLVLALPTSDLHLWMARVEDAVDRGLMEAYRALLSPAEAAQAGRFAFERDRRRYLVTRALVRSVLSRYAQGRRAPMEWAFAANEYGCPHVGNPLEGMPPVEFNLSHTDGLVLMAVRAQHAVGIDVEKWDRRINLDIADHFFSPAEVAALHRLPESAQRERFMELWTFKESYIKARKMGLSIPLDQFGFEMNADRDVALVLAPALRGNDAPGRWDFFQLRPDPEHVVAVCAERGSAASAGPMVLVLHRVVPLSPERPVRIDCPATRVSAPG